MSEVSLTWVEKKQFVGVDSTNHAIVISSQDADNATGMKPSDLLLLALASCGAMDVVGILKKKKQQFTDITIQVQGRQEKDPPWTFTDIHLHYLVEGENVDPAALEKAIELAENKYCSVAASLRPQVNLTSDFEIVP